MRNLLKMCSAHLIYFSVGEDCGSNNQNKCVHLRDCDEAINQIKQTGDHTMSRCGFLDDSEIVCCPNVRYNFESTAPTVLNVIAENGR